MTGKHTVQVKRVYEDPESSDGQRVLVDRVWPRGLSKERAELTDWCKDVAPSTELRQWFGHAPDKFDEFSKRYRAELDDDGDRAAALQDLRRRAKDDTLTLLTASKDSDISQAVVLRDLLTGKSND